MPNAIFQQEETWDAESTGEPCRISQMISCHRRQRGGAAGDVRLGAVGCRCPWRSDNLVKYLRYVNIREFQYVFSSCAGDVEALLGTYDRERRVLPMPMAQWSWGWTQSAETWNGRIAMLAIVVVLLLEVITGQGVLSGRLE